MLNELEVRGVNDALKELRVEYDRASHSGDVDKATPFNDFAHNRELLDSIDTELCIKRHGVADAERALTDDLHMQGIYGLDVKIIEGVDGPTARLVKLEPVRIRE